MPMSTIPYDPDEDAAPTQTAPGADSNNPLLVELATAGAGVILIELQ